MNNAEETEMDVDMQRRPATTTFHQGHNRKSGYRYPKPIPKEVRAVINNGQVPNKVVVAQNYNELARKLQLEYDTATATLRSRIYTATNEIYRLQDELMQCKQELEECKGGGISRKFKTWLGSKRQRPNDE